MPAEALSSRNAASKPRAWSRVAPRSERARPARVCRQRPKGGSRGSQRAVDSSARGSACAG
eukprot:647375-Prymnesium_polylepis.1